MIGFSLNAKNLSEFVSFVNGYSLNDDESRRFGNTIEWYKKGLNHNHFYLIKSLSLELVSKYIFIFSRGGLIIRQLKSSILTGFVMAYFADNAIHAERLSEWFEIIHVITMLGEE
jgi:hypothetical protein